MSAFLTTILSFQFSQPNKYYPVEIIRDQNLSLGLKLDVLSGFALNVHNILLFVCSLLAIRDSILSKKYKAFLKYPTIVSISCFFFLLISISVSYYSPFPSLSLTWAVQYAQVFVVALLFIHYPKDKHYKNLLFLTIAVSACYQGIIGIIQFATQSPIGLSVESVQNVFYPTGLDENNALFRVSGTFAHMNQYALMQLLLGSILIPWFIQNPTKHRATPLLLCFISIILSQSRAVWIGTAIVSLMAYRIYHASIKQFIFSLSNVHKIYMSCIFFCLLFIIISRFILATNARYTGAGIPIRQEMIKEGLVALRENPWMGYGAGTNEYTLHTLFPKGYTLTFPVAIHNGFLQLALEVGLVGLFFFLFPFFITLRHICIHAIFNTHNTRFEYAFTYISGLIALVCYYSLQVHFGTIEFQYVGLILGFGLAATMRKKQ